jgi:hypothetical protein
VDVFRSDALGWLAFPEDLEHRVVVLEDVDGQTVVAGFGVLADRLDEEEPEMQEVMDSVEWRDP